jgi:molybdate transport system ATP-binding protein
VRPERLDVLRAQLKGRLGAFDLDVDLAIPVHGLTALVGPSGCGKTTLLRCLAGFCHLAGRIAFDGEVWQDETTFTPPHRRQIGYVFQESSLFPHLSVAGNLAFGLRRVRGAVTFGFDEAVALLGLSHLLDRSTAKLSGGERQRVAIARALLTQPRLLLMDEPVSSLDLQGKAEVLESLEQVLGAFSIPVVYISHDPAEVGRLADQVLQMSAGRVSTPDPPPDDGNAALLDALAPEDVRQLALAALRAGLRAN